MYLLKLNPYYINLLMNSGILTSVSELIFPVTTSQTGNSSYSSVTVGYSSGKNVTEIRFAPANAYTRIYYNYVDRGTGTVTPSTTDVPYSDLQAYTYGEDKTIFILVPSISAITDTNTLIVLQDITEHYSEIKSLGYPVAVYDLDNLSQYDESGNNAFILFTNTSEENSLNKSLVIKKYLFGDYTNAFSIMTPVIDLELSVDSINFNYVYISNLKRYYFVRGISSISKDLSRLSFEEDVLLTYKSKIYSQNCFVSRNATYGDLDIFDEEVKYSYDREISYTTLTDLLNVFNMSDTQDFMNYVLTTISSL